ncbi:MAG: hypothetical protein ACHQ4H_14010 [Ktedonobacterales bacterium]
MLEQTGASAHSGIQRRHIVRALVVAAVLLAAVLVFFPFDWLGNVWPAYASVFDVVFATALAHRVGHATLFCICGCLLLAALPALRRRPLLYGACMLLGAIAQEGIQDLFKRQLPTAADGSDLLLDLTGIIVAWLAFALVRTLVSGVARSRAARL